MESVFGTKLPNGTDCPVGFSCWGDTIVSTREDQASFVIQQPNETYCPSGFVCSGNKMANCSLVQTIPLTFQLGDVHAGIYCPEGVKIYVDCPSGFYCPNPETKLECPEGKFCPHKTSEPSIKCQACKQGSENLNRAMYGYIILGVVGALVIISIILIMIRRKNKELFARWNELQNRLPDLSIALRKERQVKLEKLRPKLELIEKRLAQDDEVGTKSKWDQPLILESDGQVKFRARKMFDLLDANNDGKLSFSELNRILKLDPLQLHEFVERMNNLGGMPPDTKEVSRSVFVKHFLDVLDESVHFGPTREEAERLFDEIARQGSNKDGSVEYDTFFSSSLTDFLSDAQINDLLTRLMRLQGNRNSNRRLSALSVGSRSQDRRESSRPSRRESFAEYLGEFLKRDHPSRYAITRECFVEHYPKLLNDIILEPDTGLLSVCPPDVENSFAEQKMGIDIAFRDLSLTIKLKDKSVKVVDNVTGRLPARTMTAVMGGSGAGKTSFLNATCGRAFYGQVSGTIMMNGHETSIEEHRGIIGFVPQDDIVYAELTVKENFMYSGRFQLPAGTPLEEIEDLANATLASLGLSRVANSIVGDVHRRGVSGGEKKRVNIGLELMSRPKALFLDEPTSGLDASSALLVMKSLKALVENQGMTCCSVIHQPRKHIFDLFDSVVLLGVGGKTVYLGPPQGAEHYFKGLGYVLPPGESVADWLMDISSGRLHPEIEAEIPENSEKDSVANLNISASESAVLDGDAIVGSGPSINRFMKAGEEAKLRREVLYRSWNEHFDSLDKSEKEKFEAPVPTPLPVAATKPSFLTQLWIQLERILLVSWRNAFNKTVDTALIVGAVIVISAFEGVVKLTHNVVQRADFDNLVSLDPAKLIAEFGNIFMFALLPTEALQEFGLKVGVITSILVGLSAAKAITEKRLEFFREAGSGYDVNAYYLSINIIATIEHSIQMFIAGVFAVWLRVSAAAWYSYTVQFIMLGWLSVSWALFLPLIVSPQNVVLVVGFFMAFFGLLLGGTESPIMYSDIHRNPALAVISGFLSPTRYFIESLAVSEHRTLPEQSGFSIDDSVSSSLFEYYSFGILSLGRNDSNVVNQSYSGWYWGVLPAVLVGLTVRVLGAGVIHISNRSQQAKKSLRQEMAKEGVTLRTTDGWSIMTKVILYLIVFIGLLVVSVWSILRKT